MIIGRSHPKNETLKVTIDCEPGGGYVVLTRDEFEKFTAGETIYRLSSDSQGEFVVRLQLVRYEEEHDV
jgi:hypothetical protein